MATDPYPSRTAKAAEGGVVFSGCVGVLLAFSFLVIAALGVGVHLFCSALSGGVTPPDFHADAPDVVAARRTADGHTTAALDAVAARSPMLHAIGGRGTKDVCARGQANWQTVDEKAVTCTTSTTQVFAFGGDDARASMLQVLAALEGATCPPYEFPEAASGSALFLDGPGTTYRNFPDGVAIDDVGTGPVTCLPSYPVSADSVVAGRWISLPVGPERREMAQYALPATCGPGDPNDCRATPLGLDEVLREAPSTDRWAVVLTSHEDYWTADWD
ncbi:hypothetical protein [Aquihabitans sp. McL0605]|uniref:hypothetical protein n=1 Tax=Aquihabitans sp. McL0605 TaxID=3415671 RepID=UPI003CE91D70